MMKSDVGYLIKSINDKLTVKVDAELKQFNLTKSQCRVFLYLSSRGGQGTQKEIETFLGVSHPTVVGLVSRMEQNGYVMCWPCEDGRNKNVKLTPKAEDIDKDMKKKDLCEKAGISPASVTKMGRNGHVTTEILLKICTALDCGIEDIMEIVPDK